MEALEVVIYMIVGMHNVVLVCLSMKHNITIFLRMLVYIDSYVF